MDRRSVRAAPCPGHGHRPLGAVRHRVLFERLERRARRQRSTRLPRAWWAGQSRAHRLRAGRHATSATNGRALGARPARRVRRRLQHPPPPPRARPGHPIRGVARRPVATPTGGLAGPHCRVRRDIINGGRVTLRHNSRLHHIGLGHAHNGTRVLVLAADLHVRVMTQDGQLLRELELAPRRLPTPRRQTRPQTPPNMHDVARHVFSMSRDITERRLRDSNPRGASCPNGISNPAP
jgi:hypothetical protein